MEDKNQRSCENCMFFVEVVKSKRIKLQARWRGYCAYPEEESRRKKQIYKCDNFIPKSIKKDFDM